MRAAVYSHRLWVVLIFSSLFFSCGFKPGPQVLIIVGEASYKSGDDLKTLKEGQKLGTADTVIVPGNSKLKMSKSESYLYVNRESRFHLEKTGEGDASSLVLQEGELFVVARKSSVIVCKLKDLTVKFDGADAALRYDSQGNPVVEVLAGKVIVKQTGMDMIVGSCREVRFRSGQAPQESRLHRGAAERLKGWVGETAVGIPVKMSGCFRDVEEPKRDTLVHARIPQLQFESDPPDEFRTSETKKALRPRKSGPKKAVSPQMENTTPEPEIKLLMPVQAKPGQKVPIKVVSESGRAQSLSYRFDFDGDGRFELPDDGTFGKKDSVSFAFSQEGVIPVRVEVRDSSGVTVTARRNILINSPPQAKLEADIETGTTGSVFTFDASASGDPRDSLLLFRWDRNGDGTWDFPSDSGFSSSDTILRIWEKPGKYKVGVLVRDRQGACDSAWVSVEVIQGFSAGPVSGPEKASPGQNVSFSCTLQGEAEIAGFRWRFKNGNILMERQSEHPEVTVAFRMPGVYEVACDVQGKNGVLSTQQTSIRIEDSFLEVSAGGPYSGQVNKAVSFRGEARSAHGKIVQYGWDFDCDDRIDYSSAESAEAQYTFRKAGKHKVCFSVTAADGSVGRDSAVVEIGHEAPVADAGKDIVSRKGRKVKLVGSGSDSDGKVVRYEWDFDGDGVFDWSSQTSGVVEHVFDVYSYPVLRVTDADGGVGLDTVKVVVCPEGMVTVESGRFCIDEYEWPNRRGSVPGVNVTWYEAKKACEKAGKRLCTAGEWKQACTNGNDKFSFPYGRKFEAGKCNTLGNPKQTNQLSASGSFPECAGRLSVFDMSGNAAEWTASGGGENADVYGGFYQSGEKEGSCSSRLGLAKDKKYFYTGFRCCK
ncbi:MAG: PKD domain-containing protein [Chitinispirillaceae bacterium]